MTSFSLAIGGNLSGPVEYLLLEDISYPVDSLRKCYDDEEINELKENIRKYGLLQPILVRTKDDHFQIVSGCRRYYACKFLGFKKIACIVLDIDDTQTFIVSLVENISRRSLSPLEEANAFKKYIYDKGWGSLSQLSLKIGKSPSYITKRIALLNLPKDIQDKIKDSELNPSTAEELFSIDNCERQSHLANLITKRHLSIKQVREIVKDDPYYWKNLNRDNRLKSEQSIDKTIVALRIALNRIGSILEDIDEDSNEKDIEQNSLMVKELLSNDCRVLHSQIDNLLRIKKKMSKKETIYQSPYVN